MTITIDFTTLDWQMIAAVFAGLTVIVTLLAWRWSRRRNSPRTDALRLNPHGNVGAQYPTIHATSGVPSLAQLTEGIKLDAKRAFGAQRLYDVGSRQFNHYIMDWQSRQSWMGPHGPSCGGFCHRDASVSDKRPSETQEGLPLTAPICTVVAGTPTDYGSVRIRDQFVGDVGDFGKYGLLRCLTAPDLKLGVVWYFRPDEPKGSHGRFTEYLGLNYHDRAKYETCDPELWHLLGQLVHNRQRFVHCVEQSSILPAGTKYFRDMLDYSGIKPGDPRRQFRDSWLQRALRATEGADIAFLDPDNNIPPHGDQKYRKDGPKFAYLDEIREFWDRGQSVVVYHHTNMGKPVDDQIRETAGRLHHGLGADPISLRWRSFETRAFFVLPQPGHRERIETRIAQMLASPWRTNGHFVGVAR